MLSKLRVSLVFLSTLLAFSIIGLAHAETFRNPVRIPLPVDPAMIAAGDLNGDGVADLVWEDPNTSPETLHILLSQPGGGYSPGQIITYPIVTSRSALCILSDVNHDSHQDLVCSSVDANYDVFIHVFLGNGDGSLQAPISTAEPTSIYDGPVVPLISSAGDLNGDGFPDIFIDHAYAGIDVLLSDGKGGFKPPIPTPTGFINFATPVAADVNGDGIPDILWPYGPEVALGNGDGSFQPTVSYAQSYDFTAECVFHDMDGDGHLDAVCGYPLTSTGDIQGSTDLIILHGNPDGSFNGTPIATKTFGDQLNEYDGFGTFYTPVAVTDANQDGTLDILATSGDGLGVLLGGPGLTYSTPLHYAQAVVDVNIPVTTAYQSLLLDVNGDGLLDNVTTGPNGIYIAYGKKDGSFASAFAPEVAEIDLQPTVADFNGDGIPDIIAAGDTHLEVNLGKGDGTFQPRYPISNGGQAINFYGNAGMGIVHGDFNGDGELDILALGSSGVYIYDDYLFLGNGDGTFQPPIFVGEVNSAQVVPTILDDTTVFDINHDGRSDILGITRPFTVGNAQITFDLSNGNGTFRSVSTSIPEDLESNGFYSYPDTMPALADFNRDGKLDAAFGGLNNLYVVTGNGDGTFSTSSTAIPIPSLGNLPPQGAQSVATGDFDGDGNQDIVLLEQYSTGNSPGSDIYSPHANATAAWVYFGNGNGTFSAPTLAGTFNHNYAVVATSDVNQDGLADIILRNNGSAYNEFAVGIVHAQPDRTFGPEVNYTGGSSFSSMAIADLNRDGFPDLIFGNTNNGSGDSTASSVTVLLNEGNGSGSGTTAAATTTTLTCTPSTISVGGTSLLSAAVTSSNGTPTGSITFTDDSATLAQPTLTNGGATLTYTGQTAGAHTLTAAYVPTGSFDASSASCTVTVNPAVTTALTLASSLNPAPALTSITFTAQLTPASTSGTIVFNINGQNITTTPNASGVSTTTISTLTPGTYTITATWFASQNALATQATLTQVVTAPPLTPDFTLTGNGVTFAAGKTGTSSVQIASLNGFTGKVTITCIPPFPPNYTCTVKLPTVAITPNYSIVVPYTLQFSQTASKTTPRLNGRSSPRSRILYAALFPITLLSLFGISRKRRNLRALLSLALLASLAGSTTACGPDTYIPINIAGTYPITFTASGSSLPSTTLITHTLTVNATVTP